MITLATPPQVNSVLGGSALVGYDKCVIRDLTMTTATKQVTGTLALTSTAQPEMTPILGTLTITPSNARLEISVPQLGFFKRIALNGPQNTAAQEIVTNAQAALEQGLIALGAISGVFSAGA